MTSNTTLKSSAKPSPKDRWGKEKRQAYYLKNKEAFTKRAIKWRKENPEKTRKSALARYYKNQTKILEKYRAEKIEVLGHYSKGTPKCNNCPFNDLDCLDIDHLNNDGARARREGGFGGRRLRAWLKKNNYPKGYQVLCRNCNWKKHILSIKKYNK